MENERLEPLVLRDRNGRRKYLNQTERSAFLRHTEKLPPNKRAFCLVIYYTGCRISEALDLKSQQIDLPEGVLVLETLKRRQSGVYRVIPVPKELLLDLQFIASGECIFTFSRTTAWRTIKAVMRLCQIEGDHATTKGLRHGFGIAHATEKTPLNLIQRWLGHASSETTKIYLDAVGEEERSFAKRLW